MARLPTIGSDSNAWGSILNTYLSVALNTDGSLKNLFVVNGADPTGASDSTSAIQATIATAQSAGGGNAFLLPGAYSISSTLSITTDNVRIVGSGRSSVLQTTASFPASSPMIWVQGPGGAGNFRFGAGVVDLRLVNTAGPTSVIGIQLDSTYWARIHRVDVEGIYANNIYLNGITGAFGAYTSIRDCHLGNVPSGAVSGGIGILTNNHEFNVIDSCVLNWFKTAGGYAIKLQNGSNVISNCTFDENDTSIWNWFQAHNRIVNNEFDRGVTQFVYLNGCVDTLVAGNSFQGFVGTGSKTQINVDGGASNISNVVANNTCKPSGGWTNFVTEGASLGTPNTYTGNTTAGLAITQTNGIFRNNPGYNPQGAASITVTASPFTYTAGGTPETVYISGGTVSSVAKNSITLFTASNCNVNLEPGEAVTVTYTVAPTMNKDRH